jgi:hypothetical protein
MGPAIMRFLRRMRIVPQVSSRQQRIWGKASLKMAADIPIITIEIVHKSTFALAGHAVPSSALPCFQLLPSSGVNLRAGNTRFL